MEQPKREDVFKYLDGLEKVKTDPNQYTNRVIKQFGLTPEVAQGFILGWVGRDYERRIEEIEQRYQDHLQELRLDREERVRDAFETKNAKISKLIPSHTDSPVN